MTPATTDRPLGIDLFCGRGGWTRAMLDAGYRVVGFDLFPQPDYPSEAEFRQLDVRDLHGSAVRGARLAVASPPCPGFSTGRFANTKPDFSRPNAEDFELFVHAFRVIREASPTYWAVENVRGALRWWAPLVGDPTIRKLPWYVWGHFPGFVVGSSHMPKDYRHDPRAKSPRLRSALVAEIPYALARPLADACFPTPEELMVAAAPTPALPRRPRGTA